jgi:hypothetical protein
MHLNEPFSCRNTLAASADRLCFIRSRVEYPALQGESLNPQKMAGLRPGSIINFLSNEPPIRKLLYVSDTGKQACSAEAHNPQNKEYL